MLLRWFPRPRSDSKIVRTYASIKVRRILAKVDEMRAQRAKLAEDLRAETHGDDITAKLMAQVIFIYSNGLNRMSAIQFNFI